MMRQLLSKHHLSLILLNSMLGVLIRSSSAFLIGKQRPPTFYHTSTIRQMSLEVEEKFLLTDAEDLEAKLGDLGFVPKGKVTFVDWYFDTPGVHLTTRDCWFRFRESGGKGKWQLKRGLGQNTSSTVYEETEGEAAVNAAVSFVPEGSDIAKVEKFDGYAVPVIPCGGSIALVPFCRLETTRSSWALAADKTGSPYKDLVVDLDSTNTGHVVGEVETVVNDDSEVAKAKELVESLIRELTGNKKSEGGPAIGKLEHFLINNRPEHYEACVQSGVIKKY